MTSQATAAKPVSTYRPTASSGFGEDRQVHSHDQLRKEDGGHVTTFHLTVYPGTASECVLKIEVYQEAGRLDPSTNERLQFAPSSYGFRITTDNPDRPNFRSSGCGSGALVAQAKALARAAAYGNGGFPLDHLVNRK